MSFERKALDLSFAALVGATVLGSWLAFPYNPDLPVRTALSTQGGVYLIIGGLVTPEMLLYSLIRRSPKLILISLLPVCIGYVLFYLLS